MARARLEQHKRIDIFHLVLGGVVSRQEICFQFGIDEQTLDAVVKKEQEKDTKREAANARKREQRAEEKRQKDAPVKTKRITGSTPGLRKKGIHRDPIDGGGSMSGNQDPGEVPPVEIWRRKVCIHAMRIMSNPELAQQEASRIYDLCREPLQPHF